MKYWHDWREIKIVYHLISSFASDEAAFSFICVHTSLCLCLQSYECLAYSPRCPHVRVYVALRSARFLVVDLFLPSFPRRLRVLAHQWQNRTKEDRRGMFKDPPPPTHWHGGHRPFRLVCDRLRIGCLCGQKLHHFFTVYRVALPHRGRNLMEVRFI